MPLTSIAFSIDNATVASVDEVGLIEALEPGNAIVTGKVSDCVHYIACSIPILVDCVSFPCQAQAEDPVHGHLMTYSEDVVHIRVLKLTGIKLYVPSTKLLSGVEVRTIL